MSRGRWGEEAGGADTADTSGVSPDGQSPSSAEMDMSGVPSTRGHHDRPRQRLVRTDILQRNGGLRRPAPDPPLLRSSPFGAESGA